MERQPSEPIPAEIAESLDQADADLREGNTRDLRDVLAELDSEPEQTEEQ